MYTFTHIYLHRILTQNNAVCVYSHILIICSYRLCIHLLKSAHNVRLYVFAHIYSHKIGLYVFAHICSHRIYQLSGIIDYLTVYYHRLHKR